MRAAWRSQYRTGRAFALAGHGGGRGTVSRAAAAGRWLRLRGQFGHQVVRGLHAGPPDGTADDLARVRPAAVASGDLPASASSPSDSVVGFRPRARNWSLRT